MGSLFLFVEVKGDVWPLGLSAFVTGAILGAALGGILGGVIGFVQGGEHVTSRLPSGT
jgi:outer membrane lipoprotein SlyB